MPIVFRGPDPVAPEIASAYGAAQVSQQNLPQLAQQYAQQAQMAQQRSLQTAQLGLQAREGDLNRMTQGANIIHDDAARQQALQQQNQQFFTRINAEQDQVAFQAQAAAARQAQAAQLLAWVNQQDLSQKEKMRLERMRNAIGEVNSLVASNQLTPEEAQNYLVQLRTGIDPLEQRARASQARMYEQHAKQYEAQVAMQTKAQAATAAYMAELQNTLPMQKGPNGEMVMDPEAILKLPIRLMPNSNGEMHDPILPNRQMAAKMVEAKAKAAQDAADAKAKADEKAAEKEKEIQARLLQQYKDELKDKMEDLKTIEQRKFDKSNGTYQVDDAVTIRRKAIEELKDSGWIAPGVHEWLRGGQQQGQGGEQQKTNEPVQPFDPAKPQTMTPAQQTMVGNIRRVVQVIPPGTPQAAAAASVANELVGLLATGVPPKQRPEQEQRRIDAMIKSLESMEAEATRMREPTPAERRTARREQAIQNIMRTGSSSLPRALGLTSAMTREEAERLADERIAAGLIKLD